MRYDLAGNIVPVYVCRPNQFVRFEDDAAVTVLGDAGGPHELAPGLPRRREAPPKT